MTYADRFQQKHECATEITMADNLATVFEAQYPNLFFTHLPGKIRFEKPYASYMLGLFFKGNDTHQPIDFRKVGLHRTAGYILGVANNTTLESAGTQTVYNGGNATNTTINDHGSQVVIDSGIANIQI